MTTTIIPLDEKLEHELTRLGYVLVDEKQVGHYPFGVSVSPAPIVKRTYDHHEEEGTVYITRSPSPNGRTHYYFDCIGHNQQVVDSLREIVLEHGGKPE